jgi:hypothetical protein
VVPTSRDRTAGHVGRETDPVERDVYWATAGRRAGALLLDCFSMLRRFS